MNEDARQSVPPAAPVKQGGRASARWTNIGCFLLLAVALHVAFGHIVRLSQWQLLPEYNAGVQEGVAWLSGRLDLPFEGDDPTDPGQRGWDTAVFTPPGESAPRVYNVFPPLISILTAALHPLHHYPLGLPAGVWSPWTMVWLVYWPLVVVGFVAFRRRAGDAGWAALLVFALIGGTAVLPQLVFSGKGLLGQLNQVISQIGILLIAHDVLGRRRIWPGLIGLFIATYTRQLTFLYGGALIWAAWQRAGLRGAAWTTLALAVIAAPLLALNHAKFGHAFDFGYRYIYVNRDDPVARKVHDHGVFSARFIPENAYYMLLAPPRVDELTPVSIRISETNDASTSIWITTPLALMIFFAVPAWWREPAARALMLATLPILIGHLCYHSPGWLARGYNRFALDYLPVWLVVVAPWTRGGERNWRTGFTLAAVAWSVWYFTNLNI